MTVKVTKKKGLPPPLLFLLLIRRALRPPRLLALVLFLLLIRRSLRPLLLLAPSPFSADLYGGGASHGLLVDVLLVEGNEARKVLDITEGTHDLAACIGERDMVLIRRGSGPWRKWSEEGGGFGGTRKRRCEVLLGKEGGRNEEL